jgi:hypothetical protein
MERIKKLTAVLLVAALLSGCGSDVSHEDSEESMELEANSITVYYVNDLNIEPHKDSYQLKQPDILTSSVEEVIGAMTDDLSADGFEVATFMLDADDNLSLTMVESSEGTTEKTLLVKASICDTLFQLNNLREIHLIINKSDGSICSDEEFDRDSFFMYGEEENQEEDK